MTENHIIDTLNIRLSVYRKMANEYHELSLQEKQQYGAVEESTAKCIEKIKVLIHTLYLFAKQVGWAVVEEVDDNGYISRLEVI